MQSTELDQGIPAPKARWSWRVWLVVGGLTIPVLICGLFLITALPGIKASTDIEGMEAALNGFFEALDQKDVAQASVWISQHGRNYLPEAMLQEAITGPSYSYLENFERAAIDDIRIDTNLTIEDRRMEGLFAWPSGTVTYSDGYIGEYEAILEREGNQWRILDFRINASPDKIQNAGDN